VMFDAPAHIVLAETRRS